MTTKKTSAFLERLARIRRITTQGQTERIEMNRRASAPMVSELNNAGFPVEWVSDITRLGVRYDSAIPILIDWLGKSDNKSVKASIARVLSMPSIAGIDVVMAHEYRNTKHYRSVRDVIGYDTIDAAIEDGREVEPTSELFEAIDTETLREALANALEITATTTVANDLLEFAEDKDFGKSRQLIALALAKIPGPRSVTVLISLIDNQEICPFALTALGKLRAPEAAEAIAKCANSQVPEIAKAATAALKKLRPKGRA